MLHLKNFKRIVILGLLLNKNFANLIQVTALMGAHSLGLATTDNSGYSGKFTKNPGTFNNKYFTYLYDDAESYTNVVWYTFL